MSSDDVKFVLGPMFNSSTKAWLVPRVGRPVMVDIPCVIQAPLIHQPNEIVVQHDGRGILGDSPPGDKVFRLQNFGGLPLAYVEDLSPSRLGKSCIRPTPKIPTKPNPQS